MANALAPAMICAARIYCSAADQTAVNTYHFRIASVGALPATDQDLSTTVDGVLAPLYKNVLANLANYLGVQVQILKPFIQVDVETVSSFGPGTAGPFVLPRQVSGLTSYYTNVAGRKGRGRIYVPFPSTAYDGIAGTPTNSYVTQLNGLASGLISITAVAVGGRTASVVPSIYHRATASTSDIISFLSRQRWATQRRRGDYGRSNSSPL